jgi:hypothetical protein
MIITTVIVQRGKISHPKKGKERNQTIPNHLECAEALAINSLSPKRTEAWVVMLICDLLQALLLSGLG